MKNIAFIEKFDIIKIPSYTFYVARDIDNPCDAW